MTNFKLQFDCLPLKARTTASRQDVGIPWRIPLPSEDARTNQQCPVYLPDCDRVTDIIISQSLNILSAEDTFAKGTEFSELVFSVKKRAFVSSFIFLLVFFSPRNLRTGFNGLQKTQFTNIIQFLKDNVFHWNLFYENILSPPSEMALLASRITHSHSWPLCNIRWCASRVMRRSERAHLV